MYIVMWCKFTGNDGRNGAQGGPGNQGEPGPKGDSGKLMCIQD